MDETEIGLERFSVGTRPFILRAFRDPGNLTTKQISEVGDAIVSRAFEDPRYYPLAAKLCQAICQQEAKNEQDQLIPRNRFRRILISTCQDVILKCENMKKENISYWICFSNFMAELYKLIRIRGETVKGISDILVDIVVDLSQMNSMQKFEQAELLNSIMLECGWDLEKDCSLKMEQTFDAVRDAIINENTDNQIRAMLIQLIELRASYWAFSPDAREYYFAN